MKLLLVSSFLYVGFATPPPGFNESPWKIGKPEDVGLKTADLDDAKHYINQQILNRKCFIVIKNNTIVYEWYDPKAPDPPLAPKYHGDERFRQHAGYSMTKTIGAYLVGYIAARVPSFDIDAGITKTWKIPSPKPYEVTMKMMMSQTIGGDERPGESFRYDELGGYWLWSFPMIIRAATGRNASEWLQDFMLDVGLGSHTFSWDNVDHDWAKGAYGSCRDWARFGQLLLNKGEWHGRQIMKPEFVQQMQEPVKYAPYNSYANPCYGLLIWLNANKSKHPGCCWEASRLPEPKCNQKTFIDAAPSDLTFNIGLYGQVVMTIGSVDTVVVGFGNDLRPIEPTRLGYYPGMCTALNLPCNKPEPAPKTKCGEMLQCTGVTAQCFSGGSWNHSEPTPGGKQCVDCVRNRLWKYEQIFPEAHYMVKDYCPRGIKEQMKFVECFCGLTGKNDNPWHPWPSTTTTTPPPSPAPACPHPYPGPHPDDPTPDAQTCGLSPKCVAGLKSFTPKCKPIKKNGGKRCYEGLRLWGPTLTKKYGCPAFVLRDGTVPNGMLGHAWCWCGLDEDILDDTSLSTSVHEDAFAPIFGRGNLSQLSLQFDAKFGSSKPPEDSDCEKPDKYKQYPHGVGCCRDQHDYFQLKRVGGSKSLSQITADCVAEVAEHKGCRNDDSGECQTDIKACPNMQTKPAFPSKGKNSCADSCTCRYAKCIQDKTTTHDHPGFSPPCSTCHGRSMQCMQEFCAAECACDWNSNECKKCAKNTPGKSESCSQMFHHCACGPTTADGCGDLADALFEDALRGAAIMI